MTTITAGFFPVYFALMKFLGLETLLGANVSASAYLIVLALSPPILLIALWFAS